MVFGHEVRGPTAVLADNWIPSEPSQNVLDFVSGFRYRLYEARAIAQRKLGKSQCKMKRLFNKRAVDRKFKVGDQVFALLPLVSNPFQARFAGPYLVLKCLSGQNYLLKTPERRKGVQVCHINLLKPYFSPASSVGLVTAVPDVSSHLSEEGISSSESSSLNCMGDDCVHGPSRGVIEGRLNNSEMYPKLVNHLPHLSQSEKTDILRLVESFPHLFSDVPSCTTVIEHDIDVGSALPIKQHAYRVNPMKRDLLKKEVIYLLDNNLAEPSFSAWSSPCLLVNKPDGSYRFCTDYRKLNSITKPDCYPLPRIDDCVDRVGSAKFVSKFDLLKGYWQVPLTARARELSAFVTPDDFLQYRVMPFGVRNAPATFLYFCGGGVTPAGLPLLALLHSADVNWATGVLNPRLIHQSIKPGDL